jgi:hypothetical protein
MQVITPTYVTPVPMPPSVISAVEHAAKKDNMIAIVFRTKHNVILNDSSWIEGADTHTKQTMRMTYTMTRIMKLKMKKKRRNEATT